MAVIAILALVIGVRLRLLSMPLERDEGEYAYAGQLILQGIPPYQLAFNMKLPGTYAAYALIMALFGETDWGIHLGFLLLNLGALALLFAISLRLINLSGALVACACYALLSLSPGVLGLAGHATHLVAFFALAGLLLLLRTRDSRGSALMFSSGLCFGLSYMCKQPGLFFGMFGFLLVLRDTLRARPAVWSSVIRRCGLFSLGVALPFAVACLIFFGLGNFSQFWFWTFTYAKLHAGVLPPSVAWAQLTDFPNRAGWVMASWPLAGIGFVCLIGQKDRNDRKFLLLTLLLFSFLAFAAAFYFTQHYFIVVLPVVSLLAAIAVTATAEAVGGARLALVRSLPAALFVLACVGLVFANRTLWFRLGPNEASRMIYSRNPFPESVEIARFIREHSAPDTRIAVIGSEPQIYFYARRHSASGFIYMYDLVQLHRYASQFQRQMIADITAVKPDYLVLVPISSSWLNWPGADNTLSEWSAQYTREFYYRAGVAYIYPDRTYYVWGNDPLPDRKDLGYQVGVYKRKGQL